MSHHRRDSTLLLTSCLDLSAECAKRECGRPEHRTTSWSLGDLDGPEEADEFQAFFNAESAEEAHAILRRLDPKKYVFQYPGAAACIEALHAPAYQSNQGTAHFCDARLPEALRQWRDVERFLER